MTSVNSPACLLACNHFYKNLPPGPEQMKPVDEMFSCQNDSIRHNQRQVTLWVNMASPPELLRTALCLLVPAALEICRGFPGSISTNGLWVNIVLGSSSLHFSTSKPTSPADRGVK